MSEPTIVKTINDRISYLKGLKERSKGDYPKWVDDYITKLFRGSLTTELNTLEWVIEEIKKEEKK